MRKSSDMSRRDFIKKTSGGMAALAIGSSLLSTANAATNPTASDPSPAARPRTYMDRGTRLTISMWDFSWLMAHHPGGAYEDLERRVAEAAERGYNTLRVDCFPSRILERESRFEKNWEPGVNLPHWGQTATTFSCNARKEVAQLADLCRKHGIWLGLDSWDKAHMFGRGSIFSRPAPVYTFAEADEEREFAGYAQTWVKALRLMREDGVLERAVWIAPMNEVPHFAGGGLAAVRDLSKRPLDQGETQADKNHAVNAVFRRVNHWMAEPIKAEVAGEKIPISYSSLGAEPFADRLTDVYDVVDIHFMPDVITDKDDQAAFAKATRKVRPGGPFERLEQVDFKAWSRAWDTACRKHYRQMIKRTRDYHEGCLRNMTLPSGKRLVAINTEPFGPCFWPDHHKVGWEWYKRYNADALRVVAAMDLAGSSLSNYAEPIFTLWNDADWHYTSCAYLLETA
ncbi:MAG TPA: cellulase-like family protein [Armatimonadota bacterium]|nr:cellulase-like family protein [Armatimonadota bacterium]